MAGGVDKFNVCLSIFLSLSLDGGIFYSANEKDPSIAVTAQGATKRVFPYPSPEKGVKMLFLISEINF